MSFNMAPKFGKVELIIKSSNPQNLSTTKLEFDDCGLMITGDYIIVILDESDDVKHTLTSTGTIFHLNEVKAYKTHKA